MISISTPYLVEDVIWSKHHCLNNNWNKSQEEMGTVDQVQHTLYHN